VKKCLLEVGRSKLEDVMSFEVFKTSKDLMKKV
jgi:hypothetical protein